MGLSSRAWGVTSGAIVLFAALLAITSSSSNATAAVISDRAAPPPAISKVGISSVKKSPVVASPASSEAFWTKARMLSAQPADNPRPENPFETPTFGSDAGTSAATGDFLPGNVTAYPNRIQGRIFFLVGGNTYSCSGTVVDSANRNVVYTAGHCVFDLATGSWVENIAFVPGYENGNTPFDIFFGNQWISTRQWVEGGSNSYDIGVVMLSRPIQSELGSRQIAFDLNPKNREFTIFGYPSKPDPPYDGEVLRGCHSAFDGFDSSNGTTPFPMAANPCLMQQGSSGGGWITLGNYLNSVVSYGYCDSAPNLCGIIFGPYFSNSAKALYVQAGGSPAPTVKLKKAPPKVVHKRKVAFTFAGSAATLLGFRCQLDRQRTVDCSSKISITRLSPGRHTLKVRAIDQTGKLSKKQIVRKFRVVLPRR